MYNENPELDTLFQAYRSSCPDIEASPDFMPRLWAKIESTRSFPFIFQRFARILVTASAAACLLLAALNFAPHHTAERGQAAYANYTDALAADTVVERTYSSNVTPGPGRVPAGYRH